MCLFLLGLIRVLAGAQARWQGCPPKAGQRIYFANHQSHADLVSAWTNNVQRVMPKEEAVPVPVPILCSVTFGMPIALAKQVGLLCVERYRFG